VWVPVHKSTPDGKLAIGEPWIQLTDVMVTCGNVKHTRRHTTVIIALRIKWYNRNRYTKSPRFCMTTFSACLTNLTILRQSHGSSCCLRRWILTHPPLWLQKHADLRGHDLAHYPDLWHKPRLPNVTCTRSWRLCWFNPAIYKMNLKKTPQ
jgi:hypothetical protein